MTNETGVTQFRSGSASAQRQKTIRGDENPNDYDFATRLLNRERLILYRTNYVVDKLCKWLPAQALVNGWTFKKENEKTFKGLKFGNEYVFDTFTDWFHWIGAYEEVLKAMGWEFLFSQAILVCFLEDESPEQINLDDGSIEEIYGEIEPGVDTVGKIQAYYPFTDQNGYRIIQNGEWYKVYIYQKNESDLYEETKFRTKILRVHQSRIINFNGFVKELGYDGDAVSDLIVDLAIIQRQMNRATFTQLHQLSGGTVVYKSANNDEADSIKIALDTQYNYLTRIAWTGDEPLDEVLKVIVPEMKADQLNAISLLIVKEMASAMGLSIRNFGYEDIASGMGEGGTLFSLGLIKARIKEVQRRHTRPLEHLFYLLGKLDTAFIWNVPLEDMEISPADDDEKSRDLPENSAPTLKNPKNKQKTDKNGRKR